jgi:hypothetical protein
LWEIGYDSDMTDDNRESFEVLGSPLPGAFLLPHWRVEIKTRGSAELLIWRVADSAAPPADVAMVSNLITVPRATSKNLFKRGEERLKRRLRGDISDSLSVEEFAVVFRGLGSKVQSLRQIPAQEAPFFGGWGVLDDFIKLAEQPNEVIAAFASFWGPLGICTHNRPWTHSLARRPINAIEPVCTPLGIAKSQGREGWEPLDKWREYSREAKALVLDAIEIKNSRRRSRDRIEGLFARTATWLELAGVPLVTSIDLNPRAAWPCGFRATFAVTSVFQIVALQLLGVVAGGRALSLCTHCGLPFVLTGHREGERRFCSSCVEKKVAGRYAARDYRARGKAQI